MYYHNKFYALLIGVISFQQQIQNFAIKSKKEEIVVLCYYCLINRNILT